MNLPLILVALPLAGCLLLFVLPRETADRVALPLGVVVSGAALVVSVAAAAGFDYGRAGALQQVTDWPWISAIDLHLRLGVDGISLPLVVLTALLTFLGLVYSAGNLPAPGRARAYVALVLLLEVGMLGTFVAFDLLLFFVFFEIVLVPMYFLIAVWGGDNRSYAANKFILFTLLGSALMLLGLLLIYAQAGTLDMVALAQRRGDGLSRTVQLLAFAGLFIGFGVKTPMWPLHTWLPDAHTEAPTVGSVLLAGVLLKMGTYGFVRIALPILPDAARAFAPALAVLGVIGILYGSLACLAQRELKRLIAYSSVGHMGFVLLGIATLNPVGVNASLIGNIAHGLITGLLFFLVGGVKDRYHTGEIPALGGGLLQTAPRLGSLLVFASIASLGLPGLAGFWGEMLALLGAFRPHPDLSRGLFLPLMVLGGLGTVLTAAYLLSMLRRVAFGRAPAQWAGAGIGDVTAVDLAAWTPLVVAIVLVGLWPNLVLGATDGAVRALLGSG